MFLFLLFRVKILKILIPSFFYRHTELEEQKRINEVKAIKMYKIIVFGAVN